MDYNLHEKMLKMSSEEQEVYIQQAHGIYNYASNEKMQTKLNNAMKEGRNFTRKITKSMEDDELER